MLYYDVRAYYVPDTNYASEDWHAVYGEIDFNVVESPNNHNREESVGLLLPKEFSLGNFPNPFNPTTTIQYSLPERSIVNISIFDLSGKKVREWSMGEIPGGSRNISWNGTDESGNKIPAGVYIYKLDAIAANSNKHYSENKKMILMK